MFKNNISFNDLPADIRKYMHTYLDRRSLLFFSMTSKSNLRETLPAIKKAYVDFSSPKDMGLITYPRLGAFFYLKNSYYASKCSIPTSTQQFELLQSREDLPGRILKVATGLKHTLVLTTMGLYGTGGNWSGQLGLGDNESRRGNYGKIEIDPATIDQISLGYLHTLILTKDGKVYGCGNNDIQHLGLKNNSYNKLVPIPLPFENLVIKITAGNFCNVIINNANEVYISGRLDNKIYSAWTEIENIQGDIKNVYLGENHCIIWTTAGIFGLGKGFGDDLLKVDLPGNVKVKQIAVCGSQTLLLGDKGILYSYDSKAMEAFRIYYNKDTLGTIEQIAVGLIRIYAITNKGVYSCIESDDWQPKNKKWQLIDELQSIIEEILYFNKTANHLTKISEQIFQDECSLSQCKL